MLDPGADGGLDGGPGCPAPEARGCECGEVKQVLMWEPGEAWAVFEDPDCRPYVWDLPE